MKKIVLLAFVLWLLSISIFCTRRVVIVNGLTTYDVFPGKSIQKAINLAESGDIIFVHAGTYREHVVVNKTVSLIGEDKHNTIIYWNNTGNVVQVTADNTIITNFTLTLASEESAYPDSVIFLDDSDGNNISNNIISGNDTTNNDRGIYLYKSSNNNISGNNITNNDRGIYLYDASSNNIISENDITNNGNGIYIYSSSGNSIYHNNFINNAKHVDDFGLGHKPRLSVNYWDDDYPSGGNYWDDYLTRYPDAKEIDGSGIGDTPYDIYEKNQDNYPLLLAREQDVCRSRCSLGLHRE
jgi:parallel beta-helix repeat protein